jgi:anti-sigma factor RsiW
MTPDQRLLAYIDNELTPDERSLFEADLATDDRLADEVAKHRGLSARIAAAYAPATTERPPARPMIAAGAAIGAGGHRFGWLELAGMAAALAVGVTAGALFWPQPGPLATRGGVLTANGDLDKALTTALAAQGGPIKVGLTFKTKTGHYCRTFQSAPDRLAGVACRDQGHWLARTVTALSPPVDTAIPPAVQASVDAIIDGAPMDAPAERAARDRGWK